MSSSPTCQKKYYQNLFSYCNILCYVVRFFYDIKKENGYTMKKLLLILLLLVTFPCFAKDIPNPYIVGSYYNAMNSDNDMDKAAITFYFRGILEGYATAIMDIKQKEKDTDFIVCLMTVPISVITNGIKRDVEDGIVSLQDYMVPVIKDRAIKYCTNQAAKNKKP